MKVLSQASQVSQGKPGPSRVIDEVQDILDRFGGTVEKVSLAAEDWKPGAWIEQARAKHIRTVQPKPKRLGGVHPVQVESRVCFGRGFGAKGRSVTFWQLQYADGTPLGVGLFISEQAALDYLNRA